MKRILLLLIAFIALIVAPPLSAGERPVLGVAFDSNAVYVRFNKGTTHGLKNDYLGPQATRGRLVDKAGSSLGTFVTVMADDFETVAKVETLAPGRSLADVDFLEIPELGLNYLKFTAEDSPSHFLLDKGSDHIGHGVLKRAAKGNLYNAKGELAGIYTVVTVGKAESLARVTQFGPGFFAKDIASANLTGYYDQILVSSGFVNMTWLNAIMLLIAFIFLYLGIAKDYEPLLLVPIATGILIGNMPLPLSIFNSVSVYMIDPVTHEYAFNTTGNSVMGMIYFGVKSGFLPPLIFLGIGAITDFSALLSNPKSLLLGAAAQFGIFAAFLGSLALGFSPQSAASIGIIGGADGPTAIFTAGRLAPSLIGPIAIAAYSYMAMVPIIQPPIMKLLTSREERLIRMKPGRKVSKFEKVGFPIMGTLITCLVAPGGLPLLGPLFFGNLLKESGVTARLAKTASTSLLDVCTIMVGLGVGASTSAQVFLTKQSVMIFAMGCWAFATAIAAGIFLGLF